MYHDRARDGFGTVSEGAVKQGDLRVLESKHWAAMLAGLRRKRP